MRHRTQPVLLLIEVKSCLSVICLVTVVVALALSMRIQQLPLLTVGVEMLHPESQMHF